MSNSLEVYNAYQKKGENAACCKQWVKHGCDSDASNVVK